MSFSIAPKGFAEEIGGKSQRKGWTDSEARIYESSGNRGMFQILRSHLLESADENSPPGVNGFNGNGGRTRE